MTTYYKAGSKPEHRAQVRTLTENASATLTELIAKLHLAGYPVEVRHHAVQARKNLTTLHNLVVGTVTDTVHVEVIE